MARLFACVAGFALAAAPAFAQEAPRPAPTHDKSVVFAEPATVTFALDFIGGFLGDGNGEDREGFYPAFGRIVSGAGWISIGPGYRQRVLDDRAVIDVSAALSWHAYKLAQTRLEFTDLANSRIALGTQVVWQDLTQVHYFGVGPNSPVDARSEYRLKTTNLVGYASYRPLRCLSIGASGGRLAAPTLSAPTGPFDRGYPDARLTFPDDATFALVRQPAFAHGRLSITADTRNYPDHPSRGGLYEAAWARYTDLDLTSFSFNRYEVEGAHFVPLLNEGLVGAFHGWAVLSDTADGQVVPAYLMPSLGGSSTLRAYPNYRFHDRNLVVATAEARLALTMHIDTAFFVDGGSVAPSVEDLRMANASYGLGFRIHTHTRTTMRLDIAHGREGWGASFSLNDPFRLRRLMRRTAAVPFAP
jgi:hypothetical protein